MVTRINRRNRYPSVRSQVGPRYRSFRTTGDHAHSAEVPNHWHPNPLVSQDGQIDGEWNEDAYKMGQALSHIHPVQTTSSELELDGQTFPAGSQVAGAPSWHAEIWNQRVGGNSWLASYTDIQTNTAGDHSHDQPTGFQNGGRSRGRRVHSRRHTSNNGIGNGRAQRS